MSQGSSFVMEGVKNLVVKKHNLPVTKIVEELMEVAVKQVFREMRNYRSLLFQIRPGQHQEEFLYLDPKILKGGDGVPRAKNPFQEAVVFMVGGGNYIEYQNLMDFASGATAGVGGAGGGGGGGMGAAKASSANLVAAAAAAAASAASSVPKRIIYGCTTLVNANQVRRVHCKKIVHVAEATFRSFSDDAAAGTTRTRNVKKLVHIF